MKKLHIAGIILAASLAFMGCTGENSTEVTIQKLGNTHRVGPVSEYGQLLAGAPDGEGRIYGACKGIKSGAEVQLRGMSLYWSLVPRATMFYSDAGITTMVEDMKIEVIRAAIGTEENWGGTKGFILEPEAQLAHLKQVIMAAVKNDIYVIIDWHSHTATDQLEEAKEFFGIVSKEYGMLDNVIFEVFNEPTKQSWDEIKAYAEEIVSVIRENSDNLILVGNPNWDQTPSRAIGNEVQDSLHNIAYTFHYYANTHSTTSQGKSAEKAMEAGLSIFVSEWGCGKSDGTGTPDTTRNRTWQNWLDKYKLSSANWSASKINEGTAAFLEESTEENLVYSESGALVKSYFEANPDSYEACKK